MIRPSTMRPWLRSVEWPPRVPVHASAGQSGISRRSPKRSGSLSAARSLLVGCDQQTIFVRREILHEDKDYRCRHPRKGCPVRPRGGVGSLYRTEEIVTWNLQAKKGAIACHSHQAPLGPHPPAQSRQVPPGADRHAPVPTLSGECGSHATAWLLSSWPASWQPTWQRSLDSSCPQSVSQSWTGPARTVGFSPRMALPSSSSFQEVSSTTPMVWSSPSSSLLRSITSCRGGIRNGGISPKDCSLAPCWRLSAVGSWCHWYTSLSFIPASSASISAGRSFLPFFSGIGSTVCTWA